MHDDISVIINASGNLQCLSLFGPKIHKTFLNDNLMRELLFSNFVSDSIENHN